MRWRNEADSGRLRNTLRVMRRVCETRDPGARLRASRDRRTQAVRDAMRQVLSLGAQRRERGRRRDLCRRYAQDSRLAETRRKPGRTSGGSGVPDEASQKIQSAKEREVRNERTQT